VIPRGASTAGRADVESGPLRDARPLTVGVVAALPAELQSLLHATAAVGETRSVNSRVRAQAGGIGAAAARRAAESLVADGVSALVSWGFAAGLDPALTPGTLVISRQLEPPVPGAPGAATAAAAAWAARLSTRLHGLVPLVNGIIACPDHVVRTAEEKRTLGASGAVAADMESASVASVAAAAGIPWVALRVLVDTVDVIVPRAVAAAIDSSGRFEMPRFFRALAFRPMDLASLPSLASAYRRAMRTLATVARTADDGLLASSDSTSSDSASAGYTR
jgi:adenosylhomocysteine nucleosidase